MNAENLERLRLSAVQLTPHWETRCKHHALQLTPRSSAVEDDLCTHSEEVGLFMTPFPDLLHELSSHSSDVPAAFRVVRQHLYLMAEISDFLRRSAQWSLSARTT